MAEKFEGIFDGEFELKGIVGRNAAAVHLSFTTDGLEEGDELSVVGTSKRHPGEVYDALVGQGLALADALEKMAAIFREVRS